jgi:molybdopterin-biosynthesis enzyme MoeA-like protein
VTSLSGSAEILIIGDNLIDIQKAVEDLYLSPTAVITGGRPTFDDMTLGLANVLHEF